MEAQIALRNPEIYPSNEVLEGTLGKPLYKVLESFITTITNEEYGLTVEWRFYNDGKAWLCKVVYKKKTILWLSVWKGFFKTSFYFTEKHFEGIAALNISETIKENFAKAKPSSRLRPMIIDINNQTQIEDVLTIIRFKKSLK